MRFARILVIATVSFAFTSAFSATTSLESTTVRASASSTAKAKAKLPAGTEVQIISQSGGFTKVKYSVSGIPAEGFIATTQLEAGSKDVTKAIGTGVAARTGYGKQDVAAAINMSIPNDSAQRMMKSKPTLDVAAAADEMTDEFESLPEDVTETAEETVGAVGSAAAAVGTSATSSLTKKKNQVLKDAESKVSEVENATNAKKIKADAEAKKTEAMNSAKAKQNELTSSAKAKQNELTDTAAKKRAELESAAADTSAAKMASKGKKAVTDKRAELESQVNDQLGALNDQRDSIEGEVENNDVMKMANGMKSNAARAKGSVTGIGDMSNVEALEAMGYSKSDFSASSPFMSEGHLKSKSLK